MTTDRLLGELARQEKYLNRLPDNFEFPLFNAKTAVESQRQNGYRSTASAVRELVDNALEAGAKRIDITFERARLQGQRADAVSAVAVIDNGSGMGPTMARYALSWGGGTHFDDPDFIGKFGFGLPNASINQTRRVEVYSRAKGSADTYVAWLDLDDAVNEYGLQQIPEPKKADLPKFVKAYLKENDLTFEHGTVVVWAKPDRLTYRTGASMKEHPLDDFGVTYRYLLDDLDLRIEGVKVEVVDPLFLDPRSRYFVRPEQGGAMMAAEERVIPVQYYRDSGTLVLSAGAFVVGRQTASMPASSQPMMAEWVRKTYDPQTVFNARFMPDGRTIVFSTSFEGRPPDLYVLRPDAVSPEIIGRGTHLMSISSSGRLLVQTGASRIAMDRASGKAARMDDLYSAPRPLGDNVRAADWGPGDTIALVRDANGVDQLEYPEGTVLYSTSGFVSHIRVSPDGNHVAFFDHDVRFDDRGWLKSVDRSGNLMTLAGAANGGEFWGQSGLTWSRDGSTVLFTALIATEETPLRAVTFAAPGKHQVLLQSAGNLAIYDVAPDGALLVDRVNWRNGIMALTPGHQVERDLTVAGNTWFGFLSPRDARQYLFTEWGPGIGNDYGVALRNADETRTQHLGPGNAVGVSPDGKWALAYLSTTKEVRAYDIGSDRYITFKTSFASLSATGLSWYPDSSAALVCGSEKDLQPRCYRAGIDGSPARPVTPAGVLEGLVISDDDVLGRRTDGTFAVFTAADSAPRPANGLTAQDVLIQWNPKDRQVFGGQPAVPFLLDKIDIQSGKRQLFKSFAPPIRAGVTAVGNPITLVEEGKYYSYQYSQQLSTLYVVKGILR